MKRLAVPLLLAALLAGSGCTAQSSAPPPDSESGVHADWSALTPYQTPQNQYTRRYPGTQTPLASQNVLYDEAYRMAKGIKEQ